MLWVTFPLCIILAWASRLYLSVSPWSIFLRFDLIEERCVLVFISLTMCYGLSLFCIYSWLEPADSIWVSDLDPLVPFRTYSPIWSGTVFFVSYSKPALAWPYDMGYLYSVLLYSVYILGLSQPTLSEHLTLIHDKTQYIPGKQVQVWSWLWKIYLLFLAWPCAMGYLCSLYILDLSQPTLSERLTLIHCYHVYVRRYQTAWSLCTCACVALYVYLVHTHSLLLQANSCRPNLVPIKNNSWWYIQALLAWF